jgi:SAM-dependent methyltransferase
MSKYRNSIKKFRSTINFWIWGRDLNFLERIRIYELNKCLHYIPKGSRILDFGAGPGQQAKYLSEKGFRVTALDIATSNYSREQVYPIDTYDGINFSYEKESFDVVFSSNVFEHIKDTETTLAGLSEITTENGILILVMPSSTWRFWTMITDLINSWHSSKPHGEHSRNIIEEIFNFRQGWWLNRLETDHWTVQTSLVNGLFYTGNNIFGPRLSFSKRKILASILGSSCNIFVLKKH